MRRAGAEGADAASRAAIVGGAVSTSNAAVGYELGRTPAGTHAHSMVQLFIALGEGEDAAFDAYADVYPDDCLLLVDTVDTLGSGHPQRDRHVRAAAAARATRRSASASTRATSPTSPSRRRASSTRAGFPDTVIVLSSQLDELTIWQIIAQIADRGPPGRRRCRRRDRPAGVRASGRAWRRATATRASTACTSWSPCGDERRARGGRRSSAPTRRRRCSTPASSACGGCTTTGVRRPPTCCRRLDEALGAGRRRCAAPSRPPRRQPVAPGRALDVGRGADGDGRRRRRRRRRRRAGGPAPISTPPASAAGATSRRSIPASAAWSTRTRTTCRSPTPSSRTSAACWRPSTERRRRRRTAKSRFVVGRPGHRRDFDAPGESRHGPPTSLPLPELNTARDTVVGRAGPVVTGSGGGRRRGRPGCRPGRARRPNGRRRGRRCPWPATSAAPPFGRCGRRRRQGRHGRRRRHGRCGCGRRRAGRRGRRGGGGRRRRRARRGVVVLVVVGAVVVGGGG